MTEEPKKNHWHEMYELECLKTKDLEKQNELLAKHILELQADKGRLTDENRQAKEIIRGLKSHLDLSDCVNNDYRLQLLKQAEQFIKE